MRRRTRTRRVLKWTLSATVLLIVGVIVASAYVQVWVDTGNVLIKLIHGRLYVLSWPKILSGNPGWGYESLEALIWRWTFDWERIGNSWQFAVPLWAPLAILIVPTAILWWHDRRRLGPNACPHCGYDLTGNVSGRCPECGEAA